MATKKKAPALVEFPDAGELENKMVEKPKQEEKKPMGKHITFEHNGETYTLEYTRKAIETMERRGFKVGEIQDKPMTVLPEMFSGAFIAHHTGLKRKIMDEIFDRISDKRALLGKLAEMYNDPMEQLFDNEGVTKTEEISWDADF